MCKMGDRECVTLAKRRVKSSFVAGFVILALAAIMIPLAAKGGF